MSDLRVNKLTLELDANEACMVGNHIKHSLLASIEDHYRNWPDETFEKQCRPDINLMKNLLYLGYGYEPSQWERELFSKLHELQSEKDRPAPSPDKNQL